MHCVGLYWRPRCCIEGQSSALRRSQIEPWACVGVGSALAWKGRRKPRESALEVNSQSLEVPFLVPLGIPSKDIVSAVCFAALLARSSCVTGRIWPLATAGGCFRPVVPHGNGEPRRDASFVVIMRLWLVACRLLQLALMTLQGCLRLWLASLHGSFPVLTARSGLASALLCTSDNSVGVRKVLGPCRSW